MLITLNLLKGRSPIQYYTHYTHYSNNSVVSMLITLNIQYYTHFT
jgi:hypothetical protein